MARPTSSALLVRSLALVVALAAMLGLGGCVTPSIPIPPPSAERMVFEIDLDLGEATFSYPATSNYADAIVYIYNRDVGVGVIATARPDGSVGPTDPFPAEAGHEIAVTFEAEEQVVSTCVRLREGSSAVDYCD